MPEEEHVQPTEGNSSSARSAQHKTVRGTPFLNCTSAYPQRRSIPPADAPAFHLQVYTQQTKHRQKNVPNQQGIRYCPPPDTSTPTTSPAHRHSQLPVHPKNTQRASSTSRRRHPTQEPPEGESPRGEHQGHPLRSSPTRTARDGKGNPSQP